MKEKSLIRSISINVLIKPISMVISFFYTPFLLSYLGIEQYGIWSTLLSVLNWITIFDFGVAGGFRNLLSSKISENNKYELSSISATAYISLGSIVSIIYIVGLIICCLIDWKSFFKTNIECQTAILVVLTFLCLNFIFGLTNSIFYSLQKAEVVSSISLLIQISNFLSVFFLSKFAKSSENGISIVAFVYAFSNVFINVCALIWIFSKYGYLIPKKRFYEKKYLSQIFGYGIKLFFLNIFGVIFFTTDNLIITRLFSPSDVTPYTICRSLFNVIESVVVAILSPMWSRYTIEYTNKNYSWIKNCLKKQLLLFLIAIVGVFVLVLILKPLSYIWLRKKLDFPRFLILFMGILCLFNIYTNIFSILLNGIGKVNSQLIVYSVMAGINIPLSIILAKYTFLGVAGICLATCICQIAPSIVLTISSIRNLGDKNV